MENSIPICRKMKPDLVSIPITKTQLYMDQGH